MFSMLCNVGNNLHAGPKSFSHLRSLIPFGTCGRSPFQSGNREYLFGITRQISKIYAFWFRRHSKVLPIFSYLGGMVVREIYVISFINLSCFYPLINPILSSFSMIFCAHSSTSKPSVSKITSGLIGTL